MINLSTSLINFAATKPIPNCDPRKGNTNWDFFGFPHWWEYISTGEKDAFGKCVPKVNFPEGLWAIGLAVVDILLTVAGIIAVVMIIIAGINYITSMGNPEKGVSARKKITNSLIGLGIVLLASAVVSFIGRNVG
jgi:Type IV secretion system pilin